MVIKLVFCEFRLCITTAKFSGRKGIGLSPYPDIIYTKRKEIKMKNQEQKTVIIPFRVTPAEKEKIEEMSYGHYKLMSDFIRECIFKKDIIIIDGADKIADELRRIGNNINQLTRAANAGIISVVDLRETRKELAELWQSLNSLQRNGR